MPPRGNAILERAVRHVPHFSVWFAQNASHAVDRMRGCVVLDRIGPSEEQHPPWRSTEHTSSWRGHAKVRKYGPLVARERRRVGKQGQT